MNAGPTPGPARPPVAVLLGIVALGAVARLAFANTELWFDEIVTVQDYVRRPFAEIVRSYPEANNHVLNSLLARAATLLLGESPRAVRLPAIAFGVASIGAFHFLVRSVVSTRSALAGTLWFALSYPHVFYSQNARGYAAYLFFGLLAGGLAFRLSEDPGRGEGEGSGRGAGWGTGLAYGLSVALGTYTLPLMLVVVAGHGVVLLATRRLRALAWLTGGGVLAAVLYAPMAGDLARYYGAHRALTGHPLVSAAFAREVGWGWGLVALGAVPALALVLRLGRRAPRWTALLFFPGLVNLAVPVVLGQGVHPRSFLYLLALAHVLGAAGLDWLEARSPRLFAGTAVGMAAMAVVVLAVLLPRPKQAFGAAVAEVEAHRGPTEPVVGLWLAGRAARFHDGHVIVAHDLPALEDVLAPPGGEGAPRRVWILYTFPHMLRAKRPDLYAWVQAETHAHAVLPGMIGDGAVHVRVWDAPTPLQ